MKGQRMSAEAAVLAWLEGLTGEELDWLIEKLEKAGAGCA
jgi:hypothetical protein